MPASWVEAQVRGCGGMVDAFRESPPITLRTPLPTKFWMKYVAIKLGMWNCHFDTKVCSHGSDTCKS